MGKYIEILNSALKSGYGQEYFEMQCVIERDAQEAILFGGKSFTFEGEAYSFDSCKSFRKFFESISASDNNARYESLLFAFSEMLDNELAISQKEIKVNDNLDEIMTITEAAERYGVNLQTLKNHFKPSIVGQEVIDNRKSAGLIRQSSKTWLLTSAFMEIYFS